MNQIQCFVKLFSSVKYILFYGNNIHRKNPTESEYLIIEIEKEQTLELGAQGWNNKNMAEYKRLEAVEKNPYKLAGLPFTVSLTELMNAKEK